MNWEFVLSSQKLEHNYTHLMCVVVSVLTSFCKVLQYAISHHLPWWVLYLQVNPITGMVINIVDLKQALEVSIMWVGIRT